MALCLTGEGRKAVLTSQHCFLPIPVAQQHGWGTQTNPSSGQGAAGLDGAALLGKALRIPGGRKG